MKNEIELIKIQASFENLKGEFEKLQRTVKEAGEAYDRFQEVVAKLEDQFGLFRRLYWKLKDQIKPIVEFLRGLPTNDQEGITVRPRGCDPDPRFGGGGATDPGPGGLPGGGGGVDPRAGD